MDTKRPMANILKKRRRQRCSWVLISISETKVSTEGLCSWIQVKLTGTTSPVRGSTEDGACRGNLSLERCSSELAVYPGHPFWDRMLRAARIVCNAVRSDGEDPSWRATDAAWSTHSCTRLAS